MSGVYISYPFCNQKCTFCNFASGVSTAETTTAYQAALLKQIRAFEWPWHPETLYFGGGTPSLMSPEFCRQILTTIASDILGEVTMEAAPGTIGCLAGINRISFGVQSFIESELRQTGRRHTAQTVVQDIKTLQNAGIANYNIDLIAGLPGQTRESWSQSLDWIARLNPPHVSVYIFEVDEDSRLGKEMLLGGIRYGASAVPSDDLIAELYEIAVARLTALGIPRYEISNFARPGFESRHNLKYWRLEPYVGFGLDAHSHLNGHRFNSSDNMSEYLANPLAYAADTLADPQEEHFFVGLRLDAGIEPTSHEWNRFAEPIHKWTRAGMLIRSDQRLRLSPRGVLVSNEIFEDFLETTSLGNSELYP